MAALAGTYACDARTPTAPAPALTPATLLHDDENGSMLGSIDLAPGSGVSTFASIPENKWALVRVSGKWIVKPNPACAGQPPNWPCSSLWPYSGYNPDYPDAFAGPVRVKTGPLGSTDALELRGVGGQDEAIGLTQREFPRVVEASPALINPTVQAFGNTGPSVQSYIFDGSYTVMVTQIASPIRVMEGAVEADGSRTYTVEPLYGLQFINPFGSSDPPGAIRWFFVPGDSVDPVATNSDPPWRIEECRNELTCRWQRPGPGRVQVSSFVETRRVRARSVSEPQCVSVAAGRCGQEPKLVLRCDGRADADSLLRGERMECIASAEPAAAAISGLQWQFTDEQEHIIPGPPNEAKWAGIMAVGGQVQVSASVNGKALSATLAVTVRPRDWTGRVTFPPEPQPEWKRDDPLIYPPTIEGDTLADGTLGKTQYPLPEADPGFGQGTGPNEGWYFLERVYFSPASSHIYLNVALQPSDPFYQAQRGPPPGGRVVFGQLECSQDFMRSVARHVPAHESGHYSRAKAFAESAAADSMLESAVVFGTDPFDDEAAYNTMFRRYLAADSAIQADWDKRNVLRVPCQLTVPAH